MTNVIVSQPEDFHTALSQAVSDGDLEAVLSLYDPKAVFVIKPGRVAKTPAELRDAIKHLLALKARLTARAQTFVQSDDVVLALGTFRIAGQRSNGEAFEREAKFADVLRRQKDGRWLLAVDNPYAGE